MRSFSWIGVLALIAALAAAPLRAAEPTAAGTASSAADQQPPAPAASSTVQPSASGSAGADLVVAAVKPKSGWRASKLIGSAVYNDQNQQIGSIDDLIVAPDSKVAIAVISVGGFLGMGSKLVAVPYDHLHFETTKDKGERVQLPGASKGTLDAMPSFTYGNT